MSKRLDSARYLGALGSVIGKNYWIIEGDSENMRIEVDRKPLVTLFLA